VETCWLVNAKGKVEGIEDGEGEKEGIKDHAV